MFVSLSGDLSLVLLVNDLHQSNNMGTGQRLHLDQQVYYRSIMTKNLIMMTKMFKQSSQKR